MYHKKTHIHFIGIGGIGMSAIATILKQQGYTVSGCDSNLEQKSISNLTTLGCSVFCPNNGPNCQDNSIDIVVYSTAIKPNNPEIIAAHQRGIPVVSRAHMLAQLMRTKESIAIAGSHGKTTTSSLISHVLLEAKKDPTIIIGGHLQSLGSNARLGASNLLVAEADESDRSLLLLPHSIGVVTNIDREHLDTYKDLDDIKQTFVQFLKNLPFYGKAVLCIDDPHIQSIIPDLSSDLQKRIISYGCSNKADLQLTDYRLDPNTSTAIVFKKNCKLGTFTVNLPGKHNLLNSLATIAVVQELGVDFEQTADALASFGGVDRRFTFKGTYKNAELFDDYGHHPVEIANILQVARKRARNKLIVLFQPHRFTRTQALWDDFIHVLACAPIDYLIITDIYPASEIPIEQITSSKLVKAIMQLKSAQNIFYIPEDPDFDQVHTKLDEIADTDDLILFLGAGRINTLATKLT